VDAALANVSQRVKSQMCDLVGCNPSTLNRQLPNDRPFVEGFFNILEEGGFHRLPNTTGNRPKDPRRKNPERAAVKYSIQVEDLDELLDVMLANYNSAPTASRGGRSPLEYPEYLCAHHDRWPRQADPRKVAKLLALRKWVFVRGDIAQGRRPHINFEGVRYTNDILRHAFNLIGKKIAIEIERDIRIVRAYSENGADLGALVAAPPWNRTPHTLELRRVILAQKSKGTFHYLEGHDPVMDYIDYVEKEVLKGKRVPPVIYRCENC
jgi:putative transposase